MEIQARTRNGNSTPITEGDHNDSPIICIEEITKKKAEIGELEQELFEKTVEKTQRRASIHFLNALADTEVKIVHEVKAEIEGFKKECAKQQVEASELMNIFEQRLLEKIQGITSNDDEMSVRLERIEFLCQKSLANSEKLSKEMLDRDLGRVMKEVTKIYGRLRGKRFDQFANQMQQLIELMGYEVIQPQAFEAFNIKEHEIFDEVRTGKPDLDRLVHCTRYPGLKKDERVVMAAKISRYRTDRRLRQSE